MGGLSGTQWLLLVAAFAAVVVGLAALLPRSRPFDPRERVAGPAPDGPVPTIPRELETRLWVLIRDRQHINAIQMVRDETGLGLRDAKRVVDDVQRRLPDVVR